jgi:Protein of Unknown function (DUF2784)
MLTFLDIFFTITHLAFTGFNLTGWIWKKTRKVHLVTLGLTIASWFILGIWHGWGYCFLTDWHWDVKEKLGEKNLPGSFIKYFADKISGKDINPSLIDNVTLGCLIFAVTASIYVNFIMKKKKPG